MRFRGSPRPNTEGSSRFGPFCACFWTHSSFICLKGVTEGPGRPSWLIEPSSSSGAHHAAGPPYLKTQWSHNLVCRLSGSQICCRNQVFLFQTNQPSHHAEAGAAGG